MRFKEGKIMRSSTPIDESKSSRLEVMNFLNEIQEKFPQAISFCSGRPTDKYFEIERWLSTFTIFAKYFSEQNGMSIQKSTAVLAQYGRTRGVINHLIACQVANDEGIQCDESQVIVTNGCQEAIELSLRAMIKSDTDVLLVKSPAYIGITGAAELHNIALAGFSCEDVAKTFCALEEAVVAVETAGRVVKLLYLVPDFDNPTGVVLSRQQRIDIIEFCAKKKITILEDNPYGMFRYDGEKVPSMYELDSQGCVIYLGTYSKTICPALRIGFAILPTKLHGDKEASLLLMGRLLQIKSLLTVNTSQVSQAIVGGVLLSQDYSLRKLTDANTAFYRSNRDLMLRCMEEIFPLIDSSISWNVPEGGFFLTVALPFPFLEEDAIACANDFKVLAMPLSFFSLDVRQDFHLRLAFSNISPDDIYEGITRLGKFIAARLNRL